MKLDISIQAPEITIPLKSDSTEVIVADLGSLSLSNSFHVAKIMDVTSDLGVIQQAAIYERHDIKLNNLQIFRYTLPDFLSTDSVCMLLAFHII